MFEQGGDAALGGRTLIPCEFVVRELTISVRRVQMPTGKLIAVAA